MQEARNGEESPKLAAIRRYLTFHPSTTLLDPFDAVSAVTSRVRMHEGESVLLLLLSLGITIVYIAFRAPRCISKCFAYSSVFRSGLRDRDGH
jgi:hypothetical protein